MKKYFISLILILVIAFPVFADDLIKVNQIELASEFSHHIELVAKTKSGQDIPYLGKVEISITNLTTKQLVDTDLHPMFGSFFHYGSNINLDKNSKYKIVFKIHPPTFMRDVSTRDKWIEHEEFEIEFDASRDVSQMTSIGKESTEDMDLEFLILPAKSMYELEHSGDDHSGSKESETPTKTFYDLPGYGLFFVIGILSGIIAGIAISTILTKKNGIHK